MNEFLRGALDYAESGCRPTLGETDYPGITVIDYAGTWGPRPRRELRAAADLLEKWALGV